MKLCVLVIAAGLFVSVNAKKDWALLFTGANGFPAYASHSCLCNGYHVLHAAGIPDERIIMIMYNDVADDPTNPYPGKLFNNYTSIDVYKGTPIDYSGNEITADLILAVLRGDRNTVKRLIGRVGKVVDSGPEDNIFVAAIGHGASGYLVMPNGTMKARQIIDTLQHMHDNKRYAELIFYLESCESGSIFQDLPKDINVYAITAANATQPAWMSYCDDPRFAKYMVCLGSQFTNGWVENTEHINIKYFTFQEQERVIKKAVNKSEPQLFGDLSILKMKLQQFFGRKPSRQQPTYGGESDPANERLLPGESQSVNTLGGPVPFHLAQLALLKRQLRKSPFDKNLQLKLARLEDKMSQVDQFFYWAAKYAYPDASTAIFDRITSAPAERISNWDCYEAVTDKMVSSCQGLMRASDIQGYALSKFSVLVNLCNRLSGAEVIRGVEVASMEMPICV